MATASLRPTTMTENASTITATSRNLWDMYREGHRLLNYGAIIASDGEVMDIADFAAWVAGGGIPDWQALANDWGLATPEQAAQLFDLVGKAFAQINAETIDGQPNYLRLLMKRVG